MCMCVYVCVCGYDFKAKSEMNQNKRRVSLFVVYKIKKSILQCKDGGFVHLSFSALNNNTCLPKTDSF